MKDIKITEFAMKVLNLAHLERYKSLFEYAKNIEREDHKFKKEKREMQWYQKSSDQCDLILDDNDDMQNFRHFVFTTAKNLHWFTDGGMFGGHLMCYGIDFLRELVDDNLAFWESCREIIQQKKEDGNGN